MTTWQWKRRHLQTWLPMALACVLAVGRVASAQDAAAVQRLFEAGKDQDVVAAVAAAHARGDADPALAYLAGQAHQRLDQDAEAQRAYATLAGRPEADWMQIGASSAALATGNLARALETATAGAAAGPGNVYAHYQLGLVKSRMSDWGGAAAAFERAAELEPTFAYAQYYAGLTNSRLKRADRTALFLERFLKLAPSAPERPAAETLLRTLRGR